MGIDTCYYCGAIQGGDYIAGSRADYFKKRREERKSFSVLLSRSKVEAIEKKLKEQGKSKTMWLEEKIDEELKK